MIAGYIQAGSIDEALQALEKNRPWGRIMAGGTDLLPKIRPTRHKRDVPLVLIDIKRIGGLKGVRLEGGQLVLGPNTLLSELGNSHLVSTHAPVLARAALAIGSPEIRNRGTVGGNLGSRNPGADLLAPLIALGARVQITGISADLETGVKDLPSMQEKIGRGAILTSIYIPVPSPVKWGYCRWAKESMGRSYLTALASVRQPKKNNLEAGIVLGGTNLWPRHLENIPLDAANPGVSHIMDAVEAEMRATGLKWSDYRRQVARAVIQDALAEVIGVINQ